jgi:transketolase
VRISFLLVFLYFIFTPFLFAEEWGSCADELDNLRNAVSEALNAAKNTEDTRKKFKENMSKLKEKKDELDNCIDYPISHDPHHDNCETLKSEYNNAIDYYISSRYEYQTALDALESRLSDVQNKMSRVEYPCGIDFSSSFPFQDKGKEIRDESPECEFVLKYKGELSDKVILEICAKHFSFEKCLKCLDLK